MVVQAVMVELVGMVGMAATGGNVAQSIAVAAKAEMVGTGGMAVVEERPAMVPMQAWYKLLTRPRTSRAVWSGLPLEELPGHPVRAGKVARQVRPEQQEATVAVLARVARQAIQV
jgi:hypothetical protein